jgi:hypothetical protein
VTELTPDTGVAKYATGTTTVANVVGMPHGPRRRASCCLQRLPRLRRLAAKRAAGGLETRQHPHQRHDAGHARVRQATIATLKDMEEEIELVRVERETTSSS